MTTPETDPAADGHEFLRRYTHGLKPLPECGGVIAEEAPKHIGRLVELVRELDRIICDGHYDNAYQFCWDDPEGTPVEKRTLMGWACPSCRRVIGGAGG